MGYSVFRSFSLFRTLYHHLFCALRMEAVEMANVSLKRPHSQDGQINVDDVKRQKLSEELQKARALSDCQAESAVDYPMKPLLQGSKNEILDEENPDRDDDGELEEEGEPESFADMMKHGLTELDVGITKFVSFHEGFSGILKER